MPKVMYISESGLLDRSSGPAISTTRTGVGPPKPETPPVLAGGSSV